jgi:tetratricopeptide (TPR) repeat protein
VFIDSLKIPALRTGCLTLRGILISLLCITWLSACSSSSKKEVADAPESAPAATAPGAAAGLDPYLAQKVDVSASVRERFDAGVKMIAAKDWARAKTQFEALHRDEPKLSGPLVNLAIIARAQNEHAQAQTLLQQAIALNRFNWDAYLLLALEFREAGEFGKAATVYDDALKLWPDNETVHLNAGILQDLYLGNLPQALAHYQRYLALHGAEDKWVKAWAADVERRIGKPGGA